MQINIGGIIMAKPRYIIIACPNLDTKFWVIKDINTDRLIRDERDHAIIFTNEQSARDYMEAL